MDSSFDRRVAGGRARVAAGGDAGMWQAVAAAALCLGGCSSGSYSSTGSYQELYPGEVQSGVFKAGNVAGLYYVSGAESGVTDADGGFTCETTQQVRFSLGNVALGSTVCAPIVHPASFAANGSFMDVSAINMTRFLMLLDGDQDFGNGIVIPSNLRSLADSWPAIDFGAIDFEEELTRVIADIASVEGRPAVSVPSSAEAFTYMDSSLSCAYSGLFVNTFAAGAFFAPTDVAVIVYRASGAAESRYSANIKRSHPQSFMYVEAAGIVELKTLPTLIDDGSGATGVIEGEYRTPDILAGNWDTPAAQQPIDRIGSFEAIRIGGGDGDFRFVGSVMAPLDTSVPILLGHTTFVLDGDTVTGEMFDLALGTPVSVSGTRLAGSDSIEFSIATSQETAVATLVLDGTGTPVGLEGAWPGVKDSTLDMIGCRMY